jgi:hypothetical protein
MNQSHLVQYSVPYRPIAKRRLCKQRPFLGNGSVNTFPLVGSRFSILQQLDYNSGNGMFLRGPCRDVTSKGQSQLLESSAPETVKRGPERVNLKNFHRQKPLPGKRRVKEEQTRKCLAGAVVICEVLRLEVAL